MNKLLAALLLCAVAGGAQAQGAKAKTEGVYAGFGLGRADGGNRLYETGSRPSFAFNLGYRFNGALSAEVYWRTMSFEILPQWSQQGYSYPDRHLGVAGVGTLPLSDAWAVTGRLGVGRTTMDQSGSGKAAKQQTSLMGGLGLTYQVSRSFSVTLGYERYSKINTGLTLFSGEVRF